MSGYKESNNISKTILYQSLFLSDPLMAKAFALAIYPELENEIPDNDLKNLLEENDVDTAFVWYSEH